MRRGIHERIYQEYRREHCDEKGDQEPNLTEEEQRGLRSLQKRIEKDDLVVMKTDKSGKMSITRKEDYLEMGKEHTAGDKIVGRDKIREIDKLMSEHSTAWCSMWRTGKNHGQEDRVISSKISKSENRAKLYLTYKDHKKEARKTRPIGTANSSNTRGFANCVSDLLEAVANSEDKSYEVISSEDLLHSAKNHNKEINKMKRNIEEGLKIKNSCWSCKRWRRKCKQHEENKTPTEETENREEVTCRRMEQLLEEIIEEVIKSSSSSSSPHTSPTHPANTPNNHHLTHPTPGSQTHPCEAPSSTPPPLPPHPSPGWPNSRPSPPSHQTGSQAFQCEAPSNKPPSLPPHPSPGRHTSTGVAPSTTQPWMKELMEEIIDEVARMEAFTNSEKEEVCEDCDEEVKSSYMEECSKCGPGMSADLPRMALVGMDAVALFLAYQGRGLEL